MLALGFFTPDEAAPQVFVEFKDIKSVQKTNRARKREECIESDSEPRLQAY